MISKDQIKEFAKRFAIDEFTIMREYLQIVFLSILYETKISQSIFFKGGTAIHLLMKANRFSEDLDFTAELSFEELSPLLEETVRKMNTLIPNTLLKKHRRERQSVRGVLSYQPEEAKHPFTVHIEFSLREKVLTKKETVLETDFPISSSPVIQHLDWPEMLAEKVRAFTKRAQGRDLYDLWFLLSHGTELNWDFVNKKLEYYGTSTSPQDILEKILKFDEKKLKDDLTKFLPSRDRNLPAHLKGLLESQFRARFHFAIRTSKHLDYDRSPWWAGSGSHSKDKNLLPNPSEFKMEDASKHSSHSLTIKMKNSEGQTRTPYLESKSKVGDLQLEIIHQNKERLIGKSFEEILDYPFDELGKNR